MWKEGATLVRYATEIDPLEIFDVETTVTTVNRLDEFCSQCEKKGGPRGSTQS